MFLSKLTRIWTRAGEEEEEEEEEGLHIFLHFSHGTHCTCMALDHRVQPPQGCLSPARISFHLLFGCMRSSISANEVHHVEKLGVRHDVLFSGSRGWRILTAAFQDKMRLTRPLVGKGLLVVSLEVVRQMHQIPAICVFY